MRRDADAERFGDRLVHADRAPRAPGAAAQQIEADQQRGGGEGEQHEVPDARIGDRVAADARRIDRDAGREAALGLILAAQIDDHEMQRERRDREIEPAQAQRRQPEDDAEQRAGERSRRQRDPERRVEFAEEYPGGEGAGREQAGMAERDLARIAGEQHQRQRADRGEEHLAGEIEIEGGGEERIGGEQQHEADKADALQPRLRQRHLLRIAGAEIAARARAA